MAQRSYLRREQFTTALHEARREYGLFGGYDKSLDEELDDDTSSDDESHEEETAGRLTPKSSIVTLD